MRVKVTVYKLDSNQNFFGEVLAWPPCVQFFPSQDGRAFQVPGVLLNSGGSVHLIPLQGDDVHTEIQVMLP